MEVRSNTKAELTSVEQQLAALSRPAPPRPARTVREALAAERVPASVWLDSQECSRIQESAHFARACAQVVQLRRELAAALDFERLASRATELRKGLAEAPIVATSDPLPAAYSATLGRLVPLGGSEGVALLLTIAVELISCFGLAGLSVLSAQSVGHFVNAVLDGHARHAVFPLSLFCRRRSCSPRGKSTSWDRRRAMTLHVSQHFGQSTVTPHDSHHPATRAEKGALLPPLDPALPRATPARAGGFFLASMAALTEFGDQFPCTPPPTVASAK